MILKYMYSLQVLVRDSDVFADVVVVVVVVAVLLLLLLLFCFLSRSTSTSTSTFPPMSPGFVLWQEHADCGL